MSSRNGCSLAAGVVDLQASHSRSKDDACHWSCTSQHVTSHDHKETVLSLTVQETLWTEFSPCHAISRQSLHAAKRASLLRAKPTSKAGSPFLTVGFAEPMTTPLRSTVIRSSSPMRFCGGWSSKDCRQWRG